jgi:CRP-like cAMP-binding protein
MKEERKTKLWFFEQFDLLREMPEKIMDLLGEHSVLRASSKREPIYLQNEASNAIYFCKKGRIKISKTSSDGKETTLYVVQPGEIFGELSLIDDGFRTHRAEALDNDVMICSFDKQRFQQILDDHPELNRQIYKRIGIRLRKIEQKLSDLIFMTAEDRIINFLAEIGERHLKPSVDEAYIKPFFTHEEIAHLTATSRQTVTTVLNELKQEGLIKFSRNKMYIVHYSKLKEKLG